MKNISKWVIFICGLGFIISCGIFSQPDCSYDDSIYGFTGKIKFEEYYRSLSRDNIPYTEKYAFYEDGSFSHLKIAYQSDKGDTVRILNGKFKTYKSRNYPWHILKLSSDSIYEKQIIKDTLNDSVYFSPNFVAAKFLGFPDSLLTDARNRIPSDSSYLWKVDSTCFRLNERRWNDSNTCNDGFYPETLRTFCLKQPE